MTTVSPVNIRHHSSQIFFLVMRVFKIYLFRNLQVSIMVLLTMVTMLYAIALALTLGVLRLLYSFPGGWKLTTQSCFLIQYELLCSLGRYPKRKTFSYKVLLLKSLKFLPQKLLEEWLFLFFIMFYFSWLLVFVLVAEDITVNWLPVPPVLCTEQYSNVCRVGEGWRAWIPRPSLRRWQSQWMAGHWSPARSRGNRELVFLKCWPQLSLLLGDEHKNPKNHLFLLKETFHGHFFLIRGCLEVHRISKEKRRLETSTVLLSYQGFFNA